MRRAVGVRVACPNGECQHGRHASGNVVLHGYSKVKGRRRHRYLWTACGKTFGARTGTAYERLQYSMRRLDRVVARSVEGANKSAPARLEGLHWSTVARRLELSATLARRFNSKHVRGHKVVELQLDEINTFRSWIDPSSSELTTSERH